MSNAKPAPSNKTPDKPYVGSTPTFEHCENDPGSERLCQTGETIADRFQVVRLVKEGGYGQVYEATDVLNNKELVALKLESRKCASPLMNLESTVLQRMQGSRHVPILYGAGQVGDRFNYIAMQLLGANLSRLRRQCPTEVKRFSMGTVARLGIQCVAAIRDLHSIGYVHRDIKGSNFAIGLNGALTRTVFLLDFGLARLHLDEHGRPVDARSSIGFRGTVRYASVNVHERREAGRRDDIWSLFYSVIEWCSGRLPWTTVFSRNAVYRCKVNTKLEDLCNGLPDELLILAEHIKKLNYEDKPDYALLDNLFRRIAFKKGVGVDGPFDWEEEWRSL